MESDRLLHNDREDEVIVINQELIKLNVLIFGESQLEIFQNRNASRGMSSQYVVLKSFHIKEMNMKYKILRYNSNIPHLHTLVINEARPKI